MKQAFKSLSFFFILMLSFVLVPSLTYSEGSTSQGDKIPSPLNPGDYSPSQSSEVEVYWLSSKILKEKRSFMVNLPSNYHKSKKRYPVLYTLDGNSDLLKYILQQLSMKNMSRKIPELIIVLIKNTIRVRDMSPIKTSFCDTPGAAKFLGFIKSELLPWVDKKFRTSDFRILNGQSYSAVFTAFTLLEDPTLFNGYIATSLYFPQSARYFKDAFRKSLASKDYNQCYFYFSRGKLDHHYNKENKTAIALTAINKAIQEINPAGFNWKYMVYPEHGHLPEPSFADGLAWIFSQSKVNSRH